MSFVVTLYFNEIKRLRRKETEKDLSRYKIEEGLAKKVRGLENYNCIKIDYLLNQGSSSISTPWIPYLFRNLDQLETDKQDKYI